MGSSVAQKPGVGVRRSARAQASTARTWTTLCLLAPILAELGQLGATSDTLSTDLRHRAEEGQIFGRPPQWTFWASSVCVAPGRDPEDVTQGRRRPAGSGRLGTPGSSPPRATWALRTSPPRASTGTVGRTSCCSCGASRSSARAPAPQWARWSRRAWPPRRRSASVRSSTPARRRASST